MTSKIMGVFPYFFSNFGYYGEDRQILKIRAIPSILNIGALRIHVFSTFDMNMDNTSYIHRA